MVHVYADWLYSYRKVFLDVLISLVDAGNDPCTQDSFAECIGRGENYLQEIQKLLSGWADVAIKSASFLDDAENATNRVPNLDRVHHSPEISQNAYVELLNTAESLSNKATAICKADLNNVGKFLGDVRAQSSDFCGNRHKLMESAKIIMHPMTEDLKRSYDGWGMKLERFLQEWAKGGEELNEPEPDSKYRDLGIPGFLYSESLPVPGIDLIPELLFRISTPLSTNVPLPTKSQSPTDPPLPTNIPLPTNSPLPNDPPLPRSTRPKCPCGS